MKWLIQITRMAIVLHFLEALISAVAVTWNRGADVVLRHDFGGFWIWLTADGVAGEADFAWYLHVAIFLNRVIYLYAIYRLFRLFSGFARKAYFARETIRHLFVYTGLIVVFTVMRVGIEYLHFATATDQSAAFDGSELANLGNAVLLFIIAHILNEARKNSEELDNYF